MLSTDIRKLPPPIARRSNSAAETSGNSQSTTSNASVMGVTDSTTAVEGMQSSAASEVADQLEAPPISSFRKKRKRPYAPLPPKQTYWSEYDHPEDGSDNGDAYVIYIDPNETSTISKFFGKISRIFVRRSEAEDSTRPHRQHRTTTRHHQTKRPPSYRAESRSTACPTARYLNTPVPTERCKGIDIVYRT